MSRAPRAIRCANVRFGTLPTQSGVRRNHERQEYDPDLKRREIRVRDDEPLRSRAFEIHLHARVRA